MKMKNTTRIAALAVLGLFLSAPAWAASKYGNANIEKGKITVLREGTRLTYNEGDSKIDINHQDVIRVGKDSNIVLSTVEKSTITLGSNAVFHVKPWQRREDKGFFRMLFGRMRAKISGLGVNERFNVQTSNATIGVKGTELIIVGNVQGDTTVGVTENEVALRGVGGGQLNILEGNASGVVGGRTPGVTFTITDDFDSLESVGPTSDEAIRVPLGQLLVRNGVVTQEQVDDSERGATEGVELPGVADNRESEGHSVLDDQAESTQQSAVEGTTISVPISVDFQK